MKSNMFKRLCMILALVILIAGCGSKNSETATDTSDGKGTSSSNSFGDESRQDADSATEESGKAAGGSDGLVNYAAGRKLIRNAYLNIETKEFDSFMNSLSARIESVAGYVEKSQVSGSSYQYASNRYASITARIPNDRLDDFIATVGEMGNVTRKEITTDDVTLAYVDVESHKKSLVTEQERLLVLLEKAEELEDIIAIETRLSDVRYQLEYMESQIRTYDNLIAYSTVAMNISEVERITPAEEQNIWEKIKTGFLESLYNIGAGFRDFAVWFITSLPYIAVWAVIIAVIAVIFRKIRKKQWLKGLGAGSKGNDDKSGTQPPENME
ncbi:DUF4349 domain-containing protein [Anaerobium acetethylicum]|uniref:DUF4349 domain-containing protein n=1 Tax=Anaerobium acetethylicum TaxID=1619234 RepID=A0A1D3TS88_9FIRM|nr:DUF4349 domain-containing protein [Anaerobium acetethylicum]SCP96671.1 protein of unknown function [Anaerobium acetethylicum]